jgi:hypothetical protein
MYEERTRGNAMQKINPSPFEKSCGLRAEVGFLVGLSFLVVGNPYAYLLSILK